MTLLSKPAVTGVVIVLLLLGAVAVVSNYYGREQGTDAPAPAVAAQRSPSHAQSVIDLDLGRLKDKASPVGTVARDPFRFRPKAPALPPEHLAKRAPRPVLGPPVPLPPAESVEPPPPPIMLKFIGFVDAPSQGRRLAVLSDGRGEVFYGKEGDIIDGRYRLTRILIDSAELAYLDGRGRQVIRLSGQ
jgi:hypothetical protein